MRLIFFLGLQVFSYQSVAREIALSFDDCPRTSGPILDPVERGERIVSALRIFGVKAVFFCNSPNRDQEGVRRIQSFADSGHLIANHTDHHPDLHKISLKDFLKSIDQGDRELGSFPNFRKWFRFPYLHEGKNSQDVESVRQHLKKIGYINGYVTVDTEDWYVDAWLDNKIRSGFSFHEDRLCLTYAKMMLRQAEFYDDMALKALGRSVKHIILLHETDLNALCLEKLLSELKTDGWAFISPDEAYQDPIAAQEPSSSTKLNKGRVYALARETTYSGPWSSEWEQLAQIEGELEKQKVWITPIVSRFGKPLRSGKSLRVKVAQRFIGR
jgi:peptidoglycan/xylan/chitin deacetylase (PgdA/CDA1 family)